MVIVQQFSQDLLRRFEQRQRSSEAIEPLAALIIHDVMDANKQLARSSAIIPVRACPTRLYIYQIEIFGIAKGINTTGGRGRCRC